jgi:hypothetical protein
LKRLREVKGRHGRAREMARELERHVDDIIEAAERAKKTGRV